MDLIGNNGKLDLVSEAGHPDFRLQFAYGRQPVAPSTGVLY